MSNDIKELKKKRDQLKAELFEIELELQLIPNQLEREFYQMATSVNEQIETRLELARKALEEACNIADEFGVPFRSHGVSQLGQSYIPKSFYDKYDGIDRDLVHELTDTYPPTDDDYQKVGWERSALC